MYYYFLQGDIINSIEQHVLRAGEAAENAKVETKKAVIYTSKARMVRMIILHCLRKQIYMLNKMRARVPIIYN